MLYTFLHTWNIAYLILPQGMHVSIMHPHRHGEKALPVSPFSQKGHPKFGAALAFLLPLSHTVPPHQLPGQVHSQPPTRLPDWAWDDNFCISMAVFGLGSWADSFDVRHSGWGLSSDHSFAPPSLPQVWENSGYPTKTFLRQWQTRSFLMARLRARQVANSLCSHFPSLFFRQGAGINTTGVSVLVTKSPH